ncbi:hypothetical protein BDW75DRAFT_177846 [Aspergillus navahoensis]
MDTAFSLDLGVCGVAKWTAAASPQNAGIHSDRGHYRGKSSYLSPSIRCRVTPDPKCDIHRLSRTRSPVDTCQTKKARHQRQPPPIIAPSLSCLLSSSINPQTLLFSFSSILSLFAFVTLYSSFPHFTITLSTDCIHRNRGQSRSSMSRLVSAVVLSVPESSPDSRLVYTPFVLYSAPSRSHPSVCAASCTPASE